MRWAYDHSGNRTQEVRPGGTTNYTYDAEGGWLDSTTGPGGTTTFTHDAYGRMTSDGNSSYEYNYANQLTSQTTGGTTTSFTYDGDGRRLTETTGNQTINFRWDPRSYQLAAETLTDTSSGTTTDVRFYHHGLSTIGMDTAGAGTSYFHTDIQASVRAVTAADGTLQATAEYEPYGVLRSQTQPDPNAPANPIGWAGQYTDTSGESHLRARQYHPELGAFVTPDPAQAVSGSATYTYATGNPMVAGDPYGLWPSWSSIKSGVSDFASGAGDFLDSAVDKVNTYGPAVTGALSVASIAFPPLAPIALTAGAITAGAAAYTATQTCLGNIKGSCSGAIGNAAISTALGVGPGAALARVARLGTSIPRTAARSCSFSGDTTVLMADGTQKPIQNIEVDDKVIATDPETGEQAAKPVTHVWVHQDTLLDLEVDGEVITTTEDHPFWSATDRRFERADQLAAGEQLLDAGGRLATVAGLNGVSERRAAAYNLSVRGIHTYHVGTSAILVHNTCPVSGTYVVNSSNGVYVGQSSNISRRLEEHFRSGKFTRAEVDGAAKQGVAGGRTEREVAEQILLDKIGKPGQPGIMNKINPIGPRRFSKMPQPYGR